MNDSPGRTDKVTWLTSHKLIVSRLCWFGWSDDSLISLPTRSESYSNLHSWNHTIFSRYNAHNHMYCLQYWSVSFKKNDVVFCQKSQIENVPCSVQIQSRQWEFASAVPFSSAAGGVSARIHLPPIKNPNSWFIFKIKDKADKKITFTDPHTEIT